MRKALTTFGSILVLVFLLPSALTADLDRFHYRIIETAFMNGYVRVFKYDMKKIEALKANPDDMKKYARLEADRYMREVVELNKGGPVREDREKSGSAFRPKLWR